jgi:hypothetical protein
MPESIISGGSYAWGPIFQDIFATPELRADHRVAMWFRARIWCVRSDLS